MLYYRTEYNRPDSPNGSSCSDAKKSKWDTNSTESGDTMEYTGDKNNGVQNGDGVHHHSHVESRGGVGMYNVETRR